MKYLVLCCMLWVLHLTINAIDEYAHPRKLSNLERRNACIDLFAEAKSWENTLCKVTANSRNKMSSSNLN